MELKYNPMVQALEYIAKRSGKSSFVYCYNSAGYAAIGSFSKKSIQAFIKEFSATLSKRVFEKYEKGIMLAEINPTTYILFNDSFTKECSDVILATSDLAKDQDFVIFTQGEQFKKAYKETLDENWGYIYEDDIIMFNGFGKKDILASKIKNFNDNRYGYRKPVSKNPEDSDNLPLAYRSRKFTPKKKYTGIRSLENAVRRMW